MSTNAAEPIQRRALKNTVVGGVAFVLNSGMSLVSLPICLRAWGSDRYGAWLALLAGAAMLRTIDGGYTNYVGAQLNVLFHEDRPRMRRSLAASLPICLGLGVLQIVAWAVLASHGRLSSLFGVGAEEVARYDLVAALGILVISWTLTGGYLGILHRVQIPLGLMYQASWWAIGYQLTLGVALIGSALLGASVLQAAIAYAGLQAAIYIASAIYIRRKAPEILPWWSGPDLRTGFQDVTQSLVLTATGIGQQATTSGMVLLVTSFFGTATVPVFTSTRTLSNLWGSIAAVLATPLLPDIVRFHGTRDDAKLFKAFRAHWFFGGFVVNMSMVIAAPMIEFVYRTWTHGALHFERNLFFLSMVCVSLANFGSLMNIYLSGINNLHSQTVTTAARALVTFGGSFALAPRLGFTGLGIALVVAEIVCSVGLNVYFTNLTLSRFGSRLPYREIVVALLPTVPVQLLSIETMICGTLRPLSCAIATLALALLGWVNWGMLDQDIKSRALHLLRRQA